MKARGKREARRPWFMQYASFRPEGPKYTRGIAPFQGWVVLGSCTRGDALRACPWLSYSAPLALQNLSGKSARGAAFVSITRRWQTKLALERAVEGGFRFVTNVFGDFRDAA